MCSILYIFYKSCTYVGCFIGEECVCSVLRNGDYFSPSFCHTLSYLTAYVEKTYEYEYEAIASTADLEGKYEVTTGNHIFNLFSALFPSSSSSSSSSFQLRPSCGTTIEYTTTTTTTHLATTSCSGTKRKKAESVPLLVVA